MFCLEILVFRNPELYHQTIEYWIIDRNFYYKSLFWCKLLTPFFKITVEYTVTLCFHTAGRCIINLLLSVFDDLAMKHVLLLQPSLITVV